jgi:hypothetical protein
MYWRRLVLNKEEWKALLKEARAHTGMMMIMIMTIYSVPPFCELRLRRKNRTLLVSVSMRHALLTRNIRVFLTSRCLENVQIRHNIMANSETVSEKLLWKLVRKET